MINSALGIIFSNMHDEAMRELTAHRTVASVPIGGRYRLIDFVLSNMYNSGITKVGVITKNNYQSLIDHLGSGKEWDLSHKREGLYILPPFGRSQSGVYKTRLDALSGIFEFIHRSTNENVLLCDCDEVCNMDFKEPLAFHTQNHADITAVYKTRRRSKMPCHGDLAYTVDESGRVTDLVLDPDTDEEYNSGMNIWIVRKSVLERIISDAASRGSGDWKRDVLQKRRDEYRFYAWKFEGYAGHICSMDSYFRVSMDLLDEDIRQELFYKYGHIYTKIRDEVPAAYREKANVSDSLIADGCVIEGEVKSSILFRGVHVGRGAKIENAIIMQSTQVEDNVKLSYVIIDKDVTVKNNRVLMGYDTYPLFISKGSIV